MFIEIIRQCVLRRAPWDGKYWFRFRGSKQNDGKRKHCYNSLPNTRLRTEIYHWVKHKVQTRVGSTRATQAYCHVVINSQKAFTMKMIFRELRSTSPLAEHQRIAKSTTQYTFRSHSFDWSSKHRICVFFEKSEPRSRRFIFTPSAFLLRGVLHPCQSEDRMLFREAWVMVLIPPSYNSPIRFIHPAYSHETHKTEVKLRAISLRTVSKHTKRLRPHR